MTSSKESLLPSAMRSEAEARCEAALKVAREGRQAAERRMLARNVKADYMGAAFDSYEALLKVIALLEPR